MQQQKNYLILWTTRMKMNDFQKARIEILPGARRYFKSLKKNKPLRNMRMD